MGTQRTTACPADRDARPPPAPSIDGPAPPQTAAAVASFVLPHQRRTTPVHGVSVRNESAPIQLAQCRFSALAISNAKILMYFFE